MNPRLAWLAAALLLCASHVGYHVAHREPGTVALLVRLALVAVLFTLGRTMRKQRAAHKSES